MAGRLLGRPDCSHGQRRPGIDGLQDLRFRRRARGPLGAGTGDQLGLPKTWLGDDTRYSGERELANPLAAVQMGLIYVNPEGPDGNPGPDRGRPGHSRDIRPHGDERRGNRRADRRRPQLRQDSRRGRCGAGRACSGSGRHRGAGPRLAGRFGSGKGGDAISSGLEVTWTTTPTKWGNGFFANLFGYEWELTKSPAGAHQWTPKNGAGAGAIPDAPRSVEAFAPTILTTDLSLRLDPAYEKISRHFYENPDQFADAFARAWFKLTHRDMGPRTRYLGPEVPAEELIWQDPIPAVDHKLIDENDIASLKGKVLSSGLSVSQLVSTAWASASTFRGSDKRGGANGARIRLGPRRTGRSISPPN